MKKKIIIMKKLLLPLRNIAKNKRNMFDQIITTTKMNKSIINILIQ